MWQMEFSKIQIGEEFEDEYGSPFEKIDDITGEVTRGCSKGLLVIFTPTQIVTLKN